MYDELLAERGVSRAQVLLTFFDLSHRTHYLNARQALRRLLDWGVVPIINENDTTATDEITFGDNDFLAAQVAILVEADRLLLLTGVDGVYTADPATEPSAAIVREITDFADAGGPGLDRRLDLGTRLRRHALQGRCGRDGDGGRHPGRDRQRACATRRSALSWPARPTRDALPARARWASPRSSSGCAMPGPLPATVVVDAGAARALREGGTSLLPVGVVDVRGDFAAGDAVTVHVVDDDVLLGKGIVTLSSGELRRVQGLQSAQVREVLPRAAEEAVHRDYFVLA